MWPRLRRWASALFAGEESLYDAVRRTRRELADYEYQTSKLILDAYEAAEAAILVELRALVKLLGDYEAAGGNPALALAWVYQENRLNTLLAEVETQIARFSSQAYTFALAAQREGLVLGRRHSVEMGRAAVTADFGGLAQRAFEDLIGVTAGGSPLAALFEKIAPGSVFEVRRTFARGLALGHNPRKLAREVEKALQVPRNRALLIARTETLRVYRTAHQRNYEANKDVIGGWRWTCARNSRTCALCLAMDGTVHPVTESLQSHPACVVGETLVGTPGTVSSSARWYSGEVVKIATKNGHVLTVTPNHPVLTPDGYIPAGKLHKGGYVVSGPDAERAVLAVYPDNDEVPSLAKEKASLARELPGMRRRLVPTAPEDFHGDGIEGKVDIVDADRLLRREVMASIPQEVAQDAFGDGTGLAALLNGGGTGEAALEASGFAPDRVVRGLDAGGAELGGSAVLRQSVGVGVVADRDATLKQAAADHRARYSESFGERVLALSGAVSVDEVVEVEFKAFHGMVYNFETATGWYTANGIIVHNCRCSMVPLPAPGYEVPGREPWTTGAAWFDRQAPEVQDGILGATKGSMYRQGLMSLDDNVIRTDDPKWGKGVKARTIPELERLASAGLQPSRQPGFTLSTHRIAKP